MIHLTKQDVKIGHDKDAKQFNNSTEEIQQQPFCD